MKILVLTTLPVSLDTKKYSQKIKSSGGWIGMLVENIRSSSEFTGSAIISVNPSNEEGVISDEGLTCYNLQASTVRKKPQKVLSKKFQDIIDRVKPDLIDIQGIEFSIGRDMLRCRRTCPVAVTLQGLPGEIAKVYFNALPANFKYKRTIYDITHLKGTLEKQNFMKMRGKISVEILSGADYVIGRTDWDRAYSMSVNPNAVYYNCPRAFRNEFYCEKNKWELKNVRRHSIFGIQGRDSAKGLHVGIEALGMLKKEYPDVELLIPGSYKYDSPPLKMTSYEKYIRSLIKKYSVEDNVKFIGALCAQEMAEILKTSHVFCQYSLCENSPNSLGEAMTLGLPCVASFVGGTPTYLHHYKNGLSYEKSESASLAYMIKKIFENDELAEFLSENARNDALKRHDRENCRQKLFSSYADMINKASQELSDE